MSPGQYIAVLTQGADVDLESIRWRDQGFEMRDVLLVYRPGPLLGFVLLFRKHVEEPSVPDQIASTGRGAINILGSRIPYVSEEDFNQTRVNFKDNHRVKGWTSASKGGQRGHRIEGRWPPNVLLIHEAGCLPGACKPGCPALRLEQESPGVTRFYPQFSGTPAMVAWVRRLITPAWVSVSAV